jgi:hypothetical protein
MLQQAFDRKISQKKDQIPSSLINLCEALWISPKTPMVLNIRDSI